MSTAVLHRPQDVPVAGQPAHRGVTFPRVVASEWIKFRTVRSTAWALPVTAVVMVGLAVLQAWGLSTMVTSGADGTPTVDELGLGAVDVAVGGWFLAQLVVAVLGVLTITGEYSTGMIRSTVAAVPRRVPVLWAKALVLAVSVAVVSLAAVALAALAVQPWSGTLGLSLDLGDPDTVRVLLGTPLYLATITVFAFGVGALMRHSAGAIATVVGLLLVVETVFALVPLRFFEVISPFLPSTAGGRLLMSQEALDMVAVGSDVTQLSAWQGYGVLALWTAVVLGVAAVLLRRRDT